MSGRYALVIGANAYPGKKKLDNAVDDARRMANALGARGFTVSTVPDPNLTDIDAALATFRPIAQTAELALIYLAGHAVERHGSGYFLPVDFTFPTTAASLRYSATCLNDFVDATTGAASRIIVLDACRNWPHDPDEARRTSSDLDELIASERAWPNLLLAYSTSATTQASDGTKGSGSTFSSSLCRNLLDHGLTVDECFRRVSQEVVAKRSDQQPWTYSSLARTLSFTDLPRYTAIQRHSVPNPERYSTGAWTAAAFKNRGVIVGLGDTMAWRVDASGFNKINHRGDDYLVGAADCDSSLVLSGSDGNLYHVGAEQHPDIRLDTKHSFGLKANSNGNEFVHYGDGAVNILNVINKKANVVAGYDVGFEVYCCAYMPDGLIWVGGGIGEISELDPKSSDARPRKITSVKGPINAISVAPSGERIFVVGQGGLAVELDRSGAEIAQLLPGRNFKTAAGIYGQLVGDVGDDLILAYIFEPSKLPDDLRSDLSDIVGSISYHDCALAPTLPILAIATKESTVILLDIRDLQILQELDVGSGHSAMVSGVHFLSDHQLVVIGGRGEVTFFGA
ncbi:hypothetical protein C0214_13735 [Methylobacterium sp. DM1]|nr:hypothetical protein C0214_13735 [Methylobacterium sp. DM1]